MYLQGGHCYSNQEKKIVSRLLVGENAVRRRSLSAWGDERFLLFSSFAFQMRCGGIEERKSARWSG